MTDAYKRLNHEWIEWEDPSTKIPYYENTVTGEVSWDRPNIPEAYVAASQPVVDTAAIEAARREAAEREAEQQRQAAAAAAERERQREREYEMQRQAAIKAEKERIEQEKARQQAEREAAEREALERAEQLERERQAAILAERERQAKAAAEERARIEAERVRILKQQQDLIEQQKRELELQLQKLQQQQAALLEQAQVLSQQQQQLTTTPLQQQVAEVELQIDRKRGESQSFAAQIAKRAAAVQGTSAALSAGVPGTGSASVSSSPSVAQRSIQTASSIPNTHPGIVPSESLNRSSLTPTGGTITPPAGSTAPLSFAEQLAAKLASKQQQQPIATPHLTGSITPQTLLASPPPPATNTGVPAAPVAPTPAAAAAPAAAAPVATPSGSGTYPPPPAPAPNRSPPLLSSTINASAGGARVVSGVPGTPGYVPPPPRPGSASPAMGATQPNQSSPTMAYTQFQPPPLTSPTTTTAAAPVPAATATATPVAPTPAKSEPVAVPVIQPPAYVRGTSLSSSPPTIDPYTPVGNTPQRSSLSSSSTPSTTTPTLRTSTSSTSTSTSTSANYEPVTPTSATGVQAKTTQPVASPKTDTRTAPKPPSSQVSTSIPVTHHRDESLAEYSFAAFSAKNFNPENRAEGGLFKKQGSISDLAVFTKQIAKPLIKQLPIPLHKDALQTFKNVTSYMGDRRSSKDGHGHATKLLYMGINTPGLRDEIYCQLIKQTTQNPRIESEMRGWELLSMCCSVFPPSQEFHHYLSVHLQQSESTEYKSRQAIADTAAYCRQMLPITMRRGNRLLVPSPNELTAMMSRRPVDVKVELLDETFQVVLAWPQMTVREFYDKLVGLLGYKLPTYHGVPLFGLYQVATDAGMFVMESPLGDETRIMDVVSGWYQGQKKALAKNANSQLQFKLIFKAKYFVHAYLTKEVLSEECLHLYYIQAAADVVSHHLHFPLYEAVKLAALMLRVAEFNGDLKDHIHKYISVRHINQELGGKTTLAKARASKKPVKELDALIAQVLGAYQPKREMTKSQAKRALLDACIKHPLYGCHTFAVTYAVDARPNDWERKLKKWGDTQPTLQAFTGSGKNALKEPEDVWLGLGEKGVVLIDKLTREVKRHDPLHTIAKYDYTKDTFFYYVKTIEYDGSFESAQQRVQAIRCEQAQAEKIVSLIEFYWRTSNQPGTAPAGVEKSTPSTSISGTTAPSVTSPTNASVAQVTAATAALNVNVNAQPVTVGQGSWLASPTAGTAASPYHNAQTLASPSSNGYANPMSPTAVVSPTATASSTYAPPPAQHGYAQPQAQPQGYAQQQQQQAYPQAQAYPQQQQQQPQAQAYAAPSQQGYPAPPAQQARPAAAAAGYVQASPSMASRQFAPPPITSPAYTTQQLNPNNVAHFGPPGPTYGNNAPQIQ